MAYATVSYPRQSVTPAPCLRQVPSTIPSTPPTNLPTSIKCCRLAAQRTQCTHHNSCLMYALQPTR
jgi:hypothetical protein